jgi:hypothetical protein
MSDIDAEESATAEATKFWQQEEDDFVSKM